MWVGVVVCLSWSVGCDDESSPSRRVDASTPEAGTGDARVASDATIDAPLSDGGGGGNCGWDHVIRGGIAETVNDVLAMPDNSVIVGGVVAGSLDGLDGMSGGYARRLSREGQVLWTRAYGMELEVTHTIAATDGDVWLLGVARGVTACASFHGGTDVWLGKVSAADGTLLLSVCIGGDDDESPSALREHTDATGVGVQITGAVDSHESGDIGPKHGGGGFDAPDVLNAFYYTTTTSTDPNPRASCLGSLGSENGRVILTDGTIVANTFGDDSGDLAGQPLPGEADVWIASFGAGGPCTAQTCSVTATRIGGERSEGVAGGTPTGLLVGTTRSTTGGIHCPTGGESEDQLWVARVAGTSLEDLTCVRGAGTPSVRDVAEGEGLLLVAGRNTPTDADYADAELVGVPSGGNDGFALVFDSSTFALRRKLRIQNGAADGVAMRPDGCLVIVGAGGDGHVLTVPPAGG